MGDATMAEDVLDLTVRKHTRHMTSSSLITSLSPPPVPMGDGSELCVDGRRPLIDRSSSPSSASSGKVTWFSPSPRNSDNPDTRAPSDGDTVGRQTTTCRSPSQTSDYYDNEENSEDRDDQPVAGSSPKYGDRARASTFPADTRRSLSSSDKRADTMLSTESRRVRPTSAGGDSSTERCSPSSNVVRNAQPFNSMTPFFPQAAAAAAAAAFQPFNLNRLLAFQQLCAGGQLPFVSSGLSPAIHGSYPNLTAAGSPRPTAVTPSVGKSTGSLCSSSPSSTTACDYFWPIGESTPQRKRKRATANETKMAIASAKSGPLVGDLSGADSNSSDLVSRHASFPGQSASMTSTTAPSTMPYQRRNSTEWQPGDDSNMSIHGGTGSIGDDSLQSADPSYVERRRKNNEAAKRSRDARRNKERETATRAATLEQENLRLKAELTVLRAEASKLQSMLFSRF